MLSRGVYLAPSMYEAGFVSSTHTEAVIEKTLDAAKASFQSL
jgi:Glutamate-1-semialdehyde aminotransferase